MEEGRRPRDGRVAVLAALAACGSHAPEPPPLGKALAAALAAADHARAPWRCTAPDTPALATETVAGWHLADHAMTRLDAGDATIGVIADAGGSSAPTIAALARLRGQLDAAHPAAVISLGGMGATEAELTATLGTLSDHAAYPIVALPGDLEPMPGQVAAVAALRRRGDPVVDGRLVRWIEVAGATIATIPGAGGPSPARLVAGAEGCAWRAPEVAQLDAALSEKPGLRITASFEAPRLTEDGDATGELALTAAVPIDIALHATTSLSPARSGRRDGAAVALSPGSADATARVPRTRGPSAGLLAIHGAAWTWTPLVGTP